MKQKPTLPGVKNFFFVFSDLVIYVHSQIDVIRMQLIVDPYQEISFHVHSRYLQYPLSVILLDEGAWDQPFCWDVS